MRFPLMRNNILPEDLEGVIGLLKEKDPRLTSGSRVQDFERKWSDWLGVPYSVFVNSGSSANLLSIAWLKKKFPEGGKVIVPPFTWSSDISSVYWMGFEPLFLDIKLNTLGIDESLLETAIQENQDVRALFITHAQGLNALTPKIIEICGKYNVLVIEDVCESHGALLDDGRKAGSHGDISCFSYYYAHHMSTIEGGMVCTHDEETYQFLRMIRSHGMLRESTNSKYKEDITARHPDLNPLFIFTSPGFNVRNNEIGAIIGISQLNRLDMMVKRRAENFELFLDGLPEWAFKEFSLKGQSNYAFNLILNQADPMRMSRLEKTLQLEEIEYRRGSAGGGNQLRQPYVRDILAKSSIDPSKHAPVADHVHFYGMYLGNYPDLAREEIEYLTDKIRSV